MYVKKYIALVLSLSTPYSLGMRHDALAELTEKCDALTSIEPQTYVGIAIASLKTGNYLYRKNNSKRFIPASNLKLFTAAAALSLLGKDYTFETVLATDGHVKKRTLHGNVYLKASGDPSLTTADLEKLVTVLKTQNITTIKGNLIIDISEFDEIPFGPGWAWDDGAAPYNSPVSSLNVNHNCITLEVTERNNALVCTLEPSTAYVKVTNTTCIKVASTPSILQVRRRWLTRENVIDITGEIPQDFGSKSYQLTIDNPALYGATLLQELLIKQGIRLLGSYQQAVMPESAKPLAYHRSSPLAELLIPMMKNSDNLYAECLFKKLGAYKLGKPGTWQKGKEVVLGFLQEIGIPKTELNIVDGSGLSRYNLVAPDHVLTLLVWLSKSSFAQEFAASLPMPGEGTLQGRLTDSAACLKVKAKTGTLGGVSALAGYLSTQDDEPLAFVMLSNGLIKPSFKDYKVLEDTLCNYLATFSWKNALSSEISTVYA
jgi:serine-type D-Ala-D-Ala carboxypeptidase/endopeptidase (penicillin-binding protein 4)